MFRVKCPLTDRLKSMLACVLYLVFLFSPEVCWSQDNTRSLHVEQMVNMVIEIKGSMCAACLKKVEDHLAKLPGVAKVYSESKWDLRVPEDRRNHLREGCAILHVTCKENRINPKDIFEIINTDGFEAHLVD